MAFYVPEKHRVLEPTGLMSRPWINLFTEIASVLGVIVGPSGVAPMNFIYTRATQPAATTVPAGTLTFISDDRVIERSNSLTWDPYSTAQVNGGITELFVPATGAIGWVTRTKWLAPADGIVTFLNAAGTDFTRLQLGGTTASFPAIKRSSTVVHFRLADDSTWAETNAQRIRSICTTTQAGLNAVIQTNSDTAAFGGGVLVRKSRGTESAPTAVQSGDQLGGIFAQGHDGTDYGPTNVGAVLINATENYTTTTKGTEISLQVTPNGSITRVARWRVGQAGNFESVNGTELIRWGTTAAFPALKRSSAVLQTRLADDSAFAQHEALDFIAQAANRFGWSGRARLTSPADSIITLTNDAASAFDRLQFGGTSSSFPALKRSAAVLQVRLADDSANTDIQAANFVADAAGRFGWSGRARLTSPADSQVLLTNDAASDFARLMFGGTSSSFPALKRSSAELQVRLADDSADADIHASHTRTSATDFLHVTTAALADGAGAAVGTLNNAPTAGDPTKWVAINDNGTTRYIPTWT